MFHVRVCSLGPWTGFQGWLLGPKKIQFTVKEVSVHHTAICTFHLETWMNLQAQRRLRPQNKTNRIRSSWQHIFQACPTFISSKGKKGPSYSGQKTTNPVTWPLLCSLLPAGLVSDLPHHGGRSKKTLFSLLGSWEPKRSSLCWSLSEPLKC